LYYGVDQAILHFHQSHVDNSSMESPCYPDGYVDAATGLYGKGQWHECLIQVVALFDFSADCYHGDGRIERCSFNGVYQPPLGNKQFIAMSALVYTWEFLGLKTGPETDDLRKLTKRAQYVCSMSYQEQVEYYNRIVGDLSVDRKANNIHAQCFNAAYIYHLLHSGLGLPLKHTPIEVYHDINGTQVDWALGMMLVERNKGSCDTNQQRSIILTINQSTSDAIDYKLLFLSVTPTFILVSCILGYMLRRAKRKYKLLEMYSSLDQGIKLQRRMS
jgi:hypothetical protein